jgi:glycosyltransferase involved in cell wall biosynthesis
MVGRISPQKSPDTFIKAAYLIKKEIPQAYFMIIGDGEKRKEIEQLIKDTGLKDSVFISGWVDNPVNYIQLFDQAVLLSRWEGFGLVLAEYMAAGKPIIATDVDAIPELIENNENGLLVPVDDIKAICDAVLTVKNNPLLKNKFVQRGLRIAKENFDIKRVTIEHEKLFQQLLNI